MPFAPANFQNSNLKLYQQPRRKPPPDSYPQNPFTNDLCLQTAVAGRVETQYLYNATLESTHRRN